MKNLIFILGDQLSRTISSLDDVNKSNDIIFMCEVKAEAIYVKHHKKKIAFIFSAMRHFSNDLLVQGFNIKYTKFDDINNKGSFTAVLSEYLINNRVDKIIITEPGEHRVLVEIFQWESLFNIPVEIRVDSRFLCTIAEFKNFATTRKQLRLEYFYRMMRQKHKILVDNNKPLGGKWNYDADNRKTLASDSKIPKPYRQEPDAITQQVLSLVNANFKSHFGDLEPFNLAVTRQQALESLALFIQQRLKFFGDYQDAMQENEPWLYHSHLSFYLNVGLLLPKECILAAEQAYLSGKIPLNSAEGFIRQILGWREFIRGVYFLHMPNYYENNYFKARQKLPEFYWTANTKMNCIKQCVTETKNNAYAHHIQRLMVLGNFTLLAGVNPKEVSDWFLSVYADAFEWVELPNVLGMILFADGGVFASKPYAASGAYINKMSNYCKNCVYKVSTKVGSDACPFNYLYWDFLIRNKVKLINNNRVRMMYKAYEKMSKENKQLIHDQANQFFDNLKKGRLV